MALSDKPIKPNFSSLADSASELELSKEYLVELEALNNLGSLTAPMLRKALRTLSYRSSIPANLKKSDLLKLLKQELKD
ncbi:unnamed protein product [Protopolystoma xenopodis]|uniref:Uncharacterized protein n=1 Tax=Protopolystoma xenopodis TaxID=117903 RepID=A0A448WKH5_9PLAT|nr:unnamed protein product [Protopolystoma xenopodis]